MMIFLGGREKEAEAREEKCAKAPAEVAKLVDAPALGAGPARDGGSSPLLGTRSKKPCHSRFFCCFGAIDFYI